MQQNVLTFWSTIGITCKEWTIATALKLANLLTGLMHHSSAILLCWCTAKEGNLGIARTLRTAGSIKGVTNPGVSLVEGRETVKE